MTAHRTTVAQIERELEWSRLQGEWVDGDYVKDLGEHEPRIPVFVEAYDPVEPEPWWIVCDSCGWEHQFTTETAREDARASHDCETWLRERRAFWSRRWSYLTVGYEDGAA